MGKSDLAAVSKDVAQFLKLEHVSDFSNKPHTCQKAGVTGD